jgi:hypothetical protein
MKCSTCRGVLWVCENHTDTPWGNKPGECDCGAGAPCWCNLGKALPDGFVTVTTTDDSNVKVWVQ